MNKFLATMLLLLIGIGTAVATPVTYSFATAGGHGRGSLTFDSSDMAQLSGLLYTVNPTNFEYYVTAGNMNFDFTRASSTVLSFNPYGILNQITVTATPRLGGFPSLIFYGFPGLDISAATIRTGFFTGYAAFGSFKGPVLSLNVPPPSHAVPEPNGLLMFSAGLALLCGLFFITRKVKTHPHLA